MRAAGVAGGLRRWLVALVVVALLIAATFLAVTAFFPGDTYADRLEAAYKVFWMNTTRKQFTLIMRGNAWLYAIPATGVVLLSGWQLPRRYWARAVFAYVVFGIGFVGGHVFW